MISFCSDMIVIQGKIPKILINEAPIPSVTNKAGKAQQTKVPKLVNKLNVDKKN